jgi:hypothetical protein
MDMIAPGCDAAEVIGAAAMGGRHVTVDGGKP